MMRKKINSFLSLRKGSNSKNEKLPLKNNKNIPRVKKIQCSLMLEEEYGCKSKWLLLIVSYDLDFKRFRNVIYDYFSHWIHH